MTGGTAARVAEAALLGECGTAEMPAEQSSSNLLVHQLCVMENARR